MIQGQDVYGHTPRRCIEQMQQVYCFFKSSVFDRNLQVTARRMLELVVAKAGGV